MTTFFLNEVLKHYLPGAFLPFGRFANWRYRYPRPDLFWTRMARPAGRVVWENARINTHCTSYVHDLGELSDRWEVPMVGIVSVANANDITLWTSGGLAESRFWLRGMIGVSERDLDRMEGLVLARKRRCESMGYPLEAM